MTHLLSLTALGLGLSLIACSGTDAVPGGAGGASGAATGGSAGAMAGTGGAAGPNGGSGGAAASMAGKGGQAQAGAATGGSGGAGGSAGSGGAGGSGGAAAPFVLTSPAFDHIELCADTDEGRPLCELFPPANVMMSIGGENKSPELNWGAGPAGTMSYVMCLHDTSNGNTHWCLWNIPAATRQLPASLARQKMPAVPAGSSQDSFNGADDGYMGPGAKGNVYQFRLYALSAATYTPPDAEDRETVYDELEVDPDAIVLGMTTLRGRSNPN